MNFPYGRCECPTTGTDHEPNECPGPAAFRLLREGKEYKVCTRCNLSTMDTEKQLLITPEDNIEAFGEWDALGALCIVGELAKREGVSL